MNQGSGKPLIRSSKAGQTLQRFVTPVDTKSRPKNRRPTGRSCRPYEIPSRVTARAKSRTAVKTASHEEFPE